jgi:hypothetical protein
MVDYIVHNKTSSLISKKQIKEESSRKFNPLGQFDKNKLDNQKFKDNKFRGLIDNDFKKSTKKLMKTMKDKKNNLNWNN